MNVVFFASEAVPFVKTGGLADVCGALPPVLARQGIKVAVVMPRYKRISARTYGLKRVNKQVLTSQRDNVSYYFIEHKSYFSRTGLYGDKKGDYPDNLKRFQFFCQAGLALLKQLDGKPDLVHCHDWQTALIPTYLKSLLRKDPFYAKLKSVFTIHNLAYQGIFPGKQFAGIGLEDKYFHREGLEFFGQVNLMKGGLLYSDWITTVSPTYAKEIRTAKSGCGLNGVLLPRRNRLTGILNGLDQAVWDPQADPLIAQKFSAGDPKGKQGNKRALQQAIGLPERDVPLFGFVGRLSHQKGIDLLDDAMSHLNKMDLQLVVLGVGDGRTQRRLRQWAKKYPQRVAVSMKFNEPLAHQIYAGADIFLMPSAFEPCGLSQMISLRYGTIPLVFHTGGLIDTIQPQAQGGNGFVFTDYTYEAFLEAVRQAVDLYQDRSSFQRLRNQAFAHDFSWDRAAKAYANLYKKVLSRK